MVAACDEGVDTRDEIADQFGVSTSWMRRLLQRRRESGSYATRKGRRGRKAAFDAELLKKLDDLVQEQPDATLEELRARTGVSCSLVTVSNTLVRLGYRRKKRRSGPLSKIVTTSAGSGGSGDRGAGGSIPHGSSSLMRVEPRRT